jgi:hypothetical protein
LRPDDAAIPLFENKRDKKNVIQEPNTMNLYLNRFLLNPKSGDGKPDDSNVLTYNTHMKISCHPACEAASYISVLSIIPTR